MRSAALRASARRDEEPCIHAPLWYPRAHMRRSPLLLLALVATAHAQVIPAPGERREGTMPAVADTPTGAADGGVPTVLPADAGVSVEVPDVAPEDRVGRHFAFTWDTRGPRLGEADVQLWLTPRWGRPEGFTAFDLRGGVLQGLPRDWAVGVFVDAFPGESGVTQQPTIDARVMLHVQNRVSLFDRVGLGAQAELGAGVNGVAASVLLAADADLGPIRLGLNLEGFTQSAWRGRTADAFGTARFRQTLGLSYTLANGLSFGIELQNRLSWLAGGYAGDAFLIGPALAYRGSRFWFAVSLLPQVAAIKIESMRGVGDPLELTDNERFTLRISLGVTAR